MTRLALAFVLAVTLLTMCGCGSSGGGGGVMPDPIVITGEYSISINSTFDSCGFAIPGVNTAMLVEELGASSARVDIPIGGLGGTCNPHVFDRSGDIITESGSAALQLNLGCAGGDCIVQIDHTTTLEFDSNGHVTVVGDETNTVSATGGDCSCVILPCSIELSIGGSDCAGCFSCVNPLQVEGDQTESGGLLWMLLSERGDS